jgi:hypothetical protein
MVMYNVSKHGTKWTTVNSMTSIHFTRKHSIMSAKYLYQFELEENTFLRQAVAYDGIGVHYFIPESKWSIPELTQGFLLPKI